jgi:hypothetical protein
VLKKIDFNSSKVLSWSSKYQLFFSLQRHHKRHHFPNSSTLRVAGGPPTSKQIDYSSRHNPRQPKLFEENVPNGTLILKIKKKMVHKLPILFAYNTPINHNAVQLSLIVYGKDLP